MVKCTKGQVRWLKTALRWNGDPQRRQRIQMVLLRESGMTQPAIAEAMGVSLSTVNRACQSSRERDAIYTYLTAVFELVAWWAAERCAIERAHKALRLRHIIPSIRKNHLPPSFAVPLIRQRSISALARNGLVRSDSRHTSRPLNHWINS